MNYKIADILTVEIGSTITKANAYKISNNDNDILHIAQGFAPTTVDKNDVCIGVKNAIEMLCSEYNCNIDKAEVFINSSAAGGLKMTVHGLTYNMTARAAKEASLGAGAIVKLVTAGKITEYDINEIKRINPNIILLAGGVDFGATEVVLQNAQLIAQQNINIPVIYAGNSSLVPAIMKIFSQSNCDLIISPNVFPDIDVLNVEPLRRIIQDVFSKHIIHAKGMDKLKTLTKYQILPTPGAVLKSAELFSEILGDILVFDVGGATTDVHSVTDGNPEYSMKLTDPEPRAKRTVEGDLGVYVNAIHIIEQSEDISMKNKMNLVKPIPHTEEEKQMTAWLCSKAVEIAVRRHAAVVHDLYSPTGKKQVVKGKDLSAVKWVVATGGALTKVEKSREILQKICTGPGKYLLPPPEANILIDKNYLFSSLGTIAVKYSELVKKVFKKWAENIYNTVLTSPSRPKQIDIEVKHEFK